MIYVVCEGTTERQYFSQLATIYRNKATFNFKGKSTSDTESTLKKLIPKMTSHLKKAGGLRDGDKALIVFDFDLENNKAHFREAEKWQKENERHHMLILSNPCFEYWLLLHYENGKCGLSDCDEAVKRLAKHIKGYSSKNKSIGKWELTETLINTAMANSAKRVCSGRLSKSKEGLCCTAMGNAIEEIRGVQGSSDEGHRSHNIPT